MYFFDPWGCVWRRIDFKFLPDVTEGWSSFEATALSIYWWCYQICKKKNPKTHTKTINGEVMDMDAASVGGDTRSRKLLMLLHCAKVWFHGKRCENLSRFLCQEAKKEIWFQVGLWWFFKKMLASCIKSNYISRNFLKNELHRLTFHISMTHPLEKEIYNLIF